MSTRNPAHMLHPVGKRFTKGNREYQPGLGGQVTRNRPKRNMIARGDIDARPFADGEAGIGRRMNQRHSGHLLNGVQRANRLKSGLRARDLMCPQIETVRPEDSIERAARVMSECDSGTIPVVDGSGLLLGIVTDRDITVKLIARGSSIPHTQVSDCMTCEAFACSADSSIESCIRAMSWHQLRRLPVVDDEHRVVGTISHVDLARFLCEHPETVARGAMASTLLALAF